MVDGSTPDSCIWKKIYNRDEATLKRNSGPQWRLVTVYYGGYFVPMTWLPERKKERKKILITLLSMTSQSHSRFAFQLPKIF